MINTSMFSSPRGDAVFQTLSTSVRIRAMFKDFIEKSNATAVRTTLKKATYHLPQPRMPLPIPTVWHMTGMVAAQPVAGRQTQ